MSVDEAQQGGILPPTAGTTVRRRRRSRSHRSLKRTHGVKKLQRILAIIFLGSLVIAASLYFAQNFTQYEPPPHVYDR
jgi:hypothetical protein